MKKLDIVTVIFTLFAITFMIPALAQTHTDMNQSVFINAKGGIVNQKGTALGYIDKDNIVRNNQGQKLYFIDAKGNVVDTYGKTLGRAKKNGDYYNLKGETVLSLKDIDLEKCAILDPQGHNFGTVHKNYKLHACAAHCFFLEQAKKKAESKKS